jgi:hypothetical protein
MTLILHRSGTGTGSGSTVGTMPESRAYMTLILHRSGTGTGGTGTGTDRR